VERRITRAFTVQVLGRWYKTDYPHAMLAPQVSGSTDMSDTILGALLSWRYACALEVRLSLGHDSYTMANGSTGYHETRAFLTVGYRPQTP